MSFKKTSTKIIIVGILLVLFWVGFKIIPSQTPENLDKISKEFTVVASFYPIQFLTEKILGDKGQVINLVGQSDVHDFEFSPKLLIKLYQADLVIYQGGLEPWLEEPLHELAKKDIPTLALFPKLGLEDMEHEEEHEDEHEDEHEEHVDTHTWLDPVLMQIKVDLIANKLIEINPENKTVFETRANGLKKVFSEMNNHYIKGLANCRLNTVITSHGAFQRLGEQYHFEQASVTGIQAHDMPSVKNLVELKKLALSMKIKYLLNDVGEEDDFVNTLATELKLTILPVYSLEKKAQDISYLDAMNQNLESFKTALECQ